MNGTIIFSDIGRILYDKKVKKLPFIKGGGFGTVYRFDDKSVIKLLSTPSSTYRYDVMRKIKNLNLPNYYQIYEVLSNSFLFKKPYVGNIASYHKSEEVDILEKSSNWLIENYEGLCEAATKLGEANIEMVDTRPTNVIINNYGITVIDVDLYDMVDEPCVVRNICHLQTELLTKLLKENGLIYHRDILLSEMFSKVINELVINPDTKHLAKTLSGYPKPIDYIKDRIKR